MAEESSGASASEDELIARYFRPLAAGLPGAHELRDDAAAITPPGGCDLVITADMLIADVHFVRDDDPADIAYKALAVNVSDLAAKAAEPLAYSLAFALPARLEERWLARFSDGLRQAQDDFGLRLSGGDTTVSPGGPLTLSITALGSVPRGAMVRRGTARPGDGLYVSGWIGDAALGLKLRRGDAGTKSWPLAGDDREKLIKRYLRPEPRLLLRNALLAHASAAMDISDGLVIDCARMCRSSDVSAELLAERVPLSPMAAQVAAAEPGTLETLLTGGDDYEILAAIRPQDETSFESAADRAGVQVTRIGRVTGAGHALTVLSADGQPMSFARQGYDHLANQQRSPA